MDERVARAAALAGRHRAELGFVPRLWLERAAMRGELFVSEHAFASLWHRRDGVTTLHAIASERPGEGTAILAAIVADCRSRRQAWLVAKCPADLAANAWYARRGFARVGEEAGRARRLVVWRRVL